MKKNDRTYSLATARTPSTNRCIIIFVFGEKKMSSFNLILEIVVRKWKMKNEIVSESPKWKRKFCETEILGIG